MAKGYFVQADKKCFVVWNDTVFTNMAAMGYSWDTRSYISNYITYEDGTSATTNTYLSTYGTTDKRATTRTLEKSIKTITSVTATTGRTAPVTLTNKYENTQIVGCAMADTSTIRLILIPTSGASEVTLTAVYYTTDGYPVRKDFAYNGYWYEFNATDISTSEGVTIVYAAPVTPTYQNNVANTTYTATKDGDTAATVTLTADGGYKIDTASLSYTNTSGEASAANMQISADYGIATCSITDVDFADTININGTTSQKTVVPTFKNDVANTVLSYTGGEHQYVVTITPYDGYYISSDIEATYVGYSSDAPVSVTLATAADALSAKGVLPDVDENNVITVTGTTNTQISIGIKLSNCAISGTLPSFYKQGEKITVTMTANENCIFAEGSVNNLIWENSEAFEVATPFTISEDRMTATVTATLPTSYNIGWVRIVGNATPSKVIGGKYGAINVYKVTLDNLESFAKVRFFKESISGTSETDYTLINLGDYVNSIKRLFVTVPVASTDVIKCGNYNTGVECEAPDKDVITLDFGTVTIPSPNGDTTDYEGEIELFIPFKGFVTVPIDYAGKEVNLQYDVNVITGGGVAKLMSDSITFALYDVEPSQDVLYRTASETVTLVGGKPTNEMLFYGVEPFIKVKYYNSLNKSDRNNTYLTAQISTLNGFNRVDNVTLNTSPDMTIQEEETIIQTLKDGVYL